MSGAPDRNWRAQARRARRETGRSWVLPAVAAAIAGVAIAATILTLALTAPAIEAAPTSSTAPIAPPTTANPVEPTAQPTPTADVVEPEDLARTWAEEFLTRADPVDDSWQQAIAPFTAPELLALLEQSAFVEGTALDGATPTTVASIEILPPAPDVEVSTPVRWSNTVDVTVVDGAGAEHGLEYSVILFATDNGWILTDARLLSYERP